MKVWDRLLIGAAAAVVLALLAGCVARPSFAYDCEGRWWAIECWFL